MQEQLDNHHRKINQMTKNIERLEGLIMENQCRQKRILFWTQLNAIFIVISIFWKILTTSL